MHACELLPIAAVIADASATFARTPFPSSSSNLHDYWSLSRQRLDQWSQAFAEIDKPDGNKEHQTRNTLTPVIEEVLLSEVLTRVWAAVTAFHDVQHKTQSIAPVVRSVYLGHQEARNRCLLAILKRQVSEEGEARRLNVLRQKCERWTDMFLAYIPMHSEVEKLTFDPQRSKEFAIDLQHEGRHRDAVQTLTMASLEAAAQQVSHSTAANGDLNRRIASSIIACLPTDAFDPAGLSSLWWQSRMERHTDSTLDMVAELLSLESH